MKKTLNLLSLMAFGLLIAGIVVVMTAGSPARLPLGPSLAPPPAATPIPAGSTALDPLSMLVGIVAGYVLSFAGRVPWLELPYRAVAWLVRNERNILRIGMAIFLLGVVIFY